jgi:futalosine hydrolase
VTESMGSGGGGEVTGAGALADRLADRLAGVELAVLFATEMEAAPFLESLEESTAFVAATKAWRVGAAPNDGGTVRTAVVVTGVDKANAAHALTCLLQAATPRLVLQAGIGGAFPGSGLRVGDVALATVDAYADTGASTPDGWLDTADMRLTLAEAGGEEYHNEFCLDLAMVAEAERVVRSAGWTAPAPLVRSGLFLTLSQVTGRVEEAVGLATRWGRPLIESMEGAAAAHVCVLYGVPFVEVRGVSNMVADRDRSSWDLEGAASRAAHAALAIAVHLDQVLAAAGEATAAASGARGAAPAQREATPGEAEASP